MLVAIGLVGAPSAGRGAFEVSWPSARSAASAGAHLELAAAPEGAAAPPEDATEERADVGVGAAADSLSAGGGPGIDEVDVSGGELYGLPEARGFRARTALVWGATTAAVTIGQLGGELYRERTIGVALARSLGSRVVVEIGGRVLSVGAPGVSRRSAVAIDAGFTSLLLDRVRLAVLSVNVSDARVGESPICSGTTVGACLALERVRLSASLEIDRGLGAVAAVGCEAAANEFLRIRAGVGIDPPIFACGLGIGAERRGALTSWPVVDLAWQWHPDLGVSCFVSVSLRR